MKTLSLRPYHGEVRVCRSLREIRRQYRELTGNAYPYEDDPGGGRFVLVEGESITDRVWLVWASTPHALAHEFAHVLLRTFRTIGHDPREGDGEPFCYMLSQLLLEAA
jgi:hypothetical protein